MLDEFEKGHRDVWNILLQLFDDGRLTDSHGRTVDFRNVLVVMTSNIGASVIANLPPEVTGTEPAVKENIMNVVRGTLSPELINRIDETVVFNRLQRENMDQIAKIVSNMQIQCSTFSPVYYIKTQRCYVSLCSISMKYLNV